GLLARHARPRRRAPHVRRRAPGAPRRLPGADAFRPHRRDVGDPARRHRHARRRPVSGLARGATAARGVPQEPVGRAIMNLHVRPIVSALLRNRTGAVLVYVQVAIALAVLVNALFIVITRMEKMARPTGMDVANIFVVQSQGFTQRYDLKSSIQEDLGY